MRSQTCLSLTCRSWNSTTQIDPIGFSTSPLQTKTICSLGLLEIPFTSFSFSMNEHGLVSLITASPPGDRIVKAKISTRFMPSLANATSKLNIRVNWFPGNALVNGLLVRIESATIEWFITQTDPNQVSGGRYHLSTRTISVTNIFF